MPSVLVAVPPELSVAGEDVENVTPEGGVPTHAGVKVTDEEKPLIELRVIVADAVCPWVTVTGEVETRIKEGVAVEDVELVVVVVVCVVVAVGTVRVDEAASLIGLPVAVIVYEPTVTLATTNEPVIVPAETEQLDPVTAVPDSEQLESLEEKPVPET